MEAGAVRHKILLDPVQIASLKKQKPSTCSALVGCILLFDLDFVFVSLFESYKYGSAPVHEVRKEKVRAQADHADVGFQDKVDREAVVDDV